MATVQIQRNEVVDVTINGTVYKIEKLGAKTGKKLITLIARTIGPAFDGDGDQIARFCAALKDDDLDWVCDTFAKQTRYSPEGQPDAECFLQQTFDRHFAGHYGTMVLWLKACLIANYESFFLELGTDPAQLLSLVQMATAPSSPTTESTPRSGAASLRNSAG